ncbi:hypothetical protein DL95DRAFT_468122 [Leptodontidium sp. 2 PMI_412]|nr:hypothetical protein DL95DRAFT_468122 [Leptodontidium sp. 2 PMI_412]
MAWHTSIDPATAGSFGWIHGETISTLTRVDRLGLDGHHEDRDARYPALVGVLSHTCGTTPSITGRQRSLVERGATGQTSQVGNSSHDNDCPLPSARGLPQAWINAVRRNFETETYETSSGNYDKLFNETLLILQEDRGIRLNGSSVAFSSHSSSPSKTEEDTAEADQGYLGDDEMTEESVESQLEDVGLANAMTHSELSADDSS